YTGEAHEPAVLREHAVEGLPPFMVPVAYVHLEALPLTPNGKVDRMALPRPSDSAVVSHEYMPAVGEIESTLARLWCAALKVPRVGRHDNFFELGGHSLLAVRLMEEMRREGLHVDVSAVFSAPTLQALAAAVGGETNSV